MCKQENAYLFTCLSFPEVCTAFLTPRKGETDQLDPPRALQSVKHTHARTHTLVHSLPQCLEGLCSAWCCTPRSHRVQGCSWMRSEALFGTAVLHPAAEPYHCARARACSCWFWGAKFDQSEQLCSSAVTRARYRVTSLPRPPHSRPLFYCWNFCFCTKKL